MKTERLFQEDSYLKSCDASIINITDDGGIITDKSCFYATGGGQPGDVGIIRLSNGQEISINNCIKDKTSDGLILVTDKQHQASIGDHITMAIDWETRYRYMRLHTALHLLCALIPYPVTGGGISIDKARLDFDLRGDALDKETINASLNNLITDNYNTSTKWIDDNYIKENPEFVRTMSVKPPSDAGQIRVVTIGNNNAQIDSQPCGGTHVKTTSEIGALAVTKIENKGKQNRRIIITFDDN